MGNVFEPIIVPVKPDNWKPGNDDYDKALRLFHLVNTLGKAIYNDETSTYNIFCIAVNGNLMWKIRTLKGAQKEEFDNALIIFSPPVVDGEKQWDQLLLSYILESKGWVYEVKQPPIPLDIKSAAPRFIETLQKGITDKKPFALTLVEELELDL